MYRVAVCDDEKTALEELCRMCAGVLARLDVEHEVKPFSSARDLAEALASGRERFDLLCLDICMEGKTGMELAHELRARDDQTSILFISSSESYLREGYSVRPIQYLSKPLREEELEEALRGDLRRNHSPKLVTFRRGNRTSALPIAEILYVESRDHGICLHMTKEDRAFSISLTEAEQMLPREQFCRCHNSFLVNMAAIQEFSRSWVTLTDDRTIPVGRRYYEQAQSCFIRYLNANR